MSADSSYTPAGPEFRERGSTYAAGLAMDCNDQTRPQIPQLWERFVAQLGKLPKRVGTNTYGVCVPQPDLPMGNVLYVAAVEVADLNDLPEGFTGTTLAAGRYAVFTHRASLDELHSSFGHIFGTWLPQADVQLTGQPDFEYYDERFDPVTASGELEIWVPVA